MIRLLALVLVAASAAAVSQEDAGVVGAPDIQYQAAVKAHDVAGWKYVFGQASLPLPDVR